MKVLIGSALDERNHSILGMGADIHERAQAGEIIRPVDEVGNRGAIEVGRGELHGASHSLGEIGLERCPFRGSRSVVYKPNRDGAVRPIKRADKQQTNDQ